MISLSTPVTVSLTLPPGVDYVAGSMAQPPGALTHIRYDRATRQLTVANIPLNAGGQVAYTYRLAINVPTTPINREIRIQATASARYEYQVEPSVLRIGQPTPQTISPSGGTYTLGRVPLTFPAGAVTHNTVITGVEYADAPIAPGHTGEAMLFEVFPALTLNQPVTAQADLRGLVITDSLVAGQWPNLDYVHTESITQVLAGGMTT